ncbi:MAG: hypothetical protein OSJ24_05855 [Muribaculaceae bacterium]|nr:hypothetical protein [Muribaculaceae bacterium]
MKKLILTAIVATAASCNAYAWWNPKELTNSIATSYELMAWFSQEGYNDALSELTYDCYPSGEKMFARRFQCNINEHPEYSSMIKSELDCAIDKFDRLLASLPASPRIRKVSSDVDGITIRAYAKSISEIASFNENTIGIGTNDITEGAVLKVNDGNIEMAQSFRVKNDNTTAAGEESLETKITNIVDKIHHDYPEADMRPAEFEFEPRNSGIIRLRNAYANSNETTIGIVHKITGKNNTTGLNNGVLAWEHISSDILAMVGEDYDMSITYVRGRRLVTLQDHKSKTILAACYKDNTCYYFVGTYRGKQPFLPSNWMYAPKAIGNAPAK